MRAAGQRSTPRQPRCHTAKCGRRFAARIHGRFRGSSIASWRRSTSTVRRSCSVTANFSWPTSEVRRSAASSDVPDTCRKPITISATATTIGMTRERVDVERPDRPARRRT